MSTNAHQKSEYFVESVQYQIEAPNKQSSDIDNTSRVDPSTKLNLRPTILNRPHDASITVQHEKQSRFLGNNDLGVPSQTDSSISYAPSSTGLSIGHHPAHCIAASTEDQTNGLNDEMQSGYQPSDYAHSSSGTETGFITTDHNGVNIHSEIGQNHHSSDTSLISRIDTKEFPLLSHFTMSKFDSSNAAQSNDLRQQQQQQLQHNSSETVYHGSANIPNTISTSASITSPRIPPRPTLPYSATQLTTSIPHGHKRKNTDMTLPATNKSPQPPQPPFQSLGSSVMVSSLEPILKQHTLQPQSALFAHIRQSHVNQNPSVHTLPHSSTTTSSLVSPTTQNPALPTAPLQTSTSIGPGPSTFFNVPPSANMFQQVQNQQHQLPTQTPSSLHQTSQFSLPPPHRTLSATSIQPGPQRPPQKELQHVSHDTPIENTNMGIIPPSSQPYLAPPASGFTNPASYPHPHPGYWGQHQPSPYGYPPPVNSVPPLQHLPHIPHHLPFHPHPYDGYYAQQYGHPPYHHPGCDTQQQHAQQYQQQHQQQPFYGSQYHPIYQHYPQQQREWSHSQDSGSIGSHAMYSYQQPQSTHQQPQPTQSSTSPLQSQDTNEAGTSPTPPPPPIPPPPRSRCRGVTRVARALESTEILTEPRIKAGRNRSSALASMTDTQIATTSASKAKASSSAAAQSANSRPRSSKTTTSSKKNATDVTTTATTATTTTTTSSPDSKQPHPYPRAPPRDIPLTNTKSPVYLNQVKSIAEMLTSPHKGRPVSISKQRAINEHVLHIKNLWALQLNELTISAQKGENVTIEPISSPMNLSNIPNLPISLYPSDDRITDYLPPEHQLSIETSQLPDKPFHLDHLFIDHTLFVNDDTFASRHAHIWSLSSPTLLNTVITDELVSAMNNINYDVLLNSLEQCNTQLYHEMTQMGISDQVPHYITLLGIVLGLIDSCQRFLDEMPVDLVRPEQYDDPAELAQSCRNLQRFLVYLRALPLLVSDRRVWIQRIHTLRGLSLMVDALILSPQSGFELCPPSWILQPMPSSDGSRSQLIFNPKAFTLLHYSENQADDQTEPWWYHCRQLKRQLGRTIVYIEKSNINPYITQRIARQLSNQSSTLYSSIRLSEALHTCDRRDAVPLLTAEAHTIWKRAQTALRELFSSAYIRVKQPLPPLQLSLAPSLPTAETPEFLELCENIAQLLSISHHTDIQPMTLPARIPKTQIKPSSTQQSRTVTKAVPPLSIYDTPPSAHHHNPSQPGPTLYYSYFICSQRRNHVPPDCFVPLEETLILRITHQYRSSARQRSFDVVQISRGVTCENVKVLDDTILCNERKGDDVRPLIRSRTGKRCIDGPVMAMLKEHELLRFLIPIQIFKGLYIGSPQYIQGILTDNISKFVPWSSILTLDDVSKTDYWTHPLPRVNVGKDLNLYLSDLGIGTFPYQIHEPRSGARYGLSIPPHVSLFPTDNDLPPTCMTALRDITLPQNIRYPSYQLASQIDHTTLSPSLRDAMLSYLPCNL